MAQPTSKIPKAVQEMADLICKEAKEGSFDIDKNGVVATPSAHRDKGVGVEVDYSTSCKAGKPTSIKPIEKKAPQGR